MTERTSTERQVPIRVLIADDNPDTRLLVHTFLSLLGFEVCTAADGLEAVTRAERFKPDVVFLDIRMPIMDGVETCLRLRAGPCPPPVPIFAVTADMTRADAMPPCFDRLLTKPVDLDFLADLATRRGTELDRSRRQMH